MKKYIKYLVFVGIILTFLFIYLIDSIRYKDYNKNIFYMDTYINVKISTNLSKKKVEKILNNVDSIYKKYHNLTNPYDVDSDLYYINNNDSKDDILTINKDLYYIINLGLTWNNKSDGKFNINIGSIIKLWKEYRENNNGIPAEDELIKIKNSINDIILLSDYKIKNTHPSIDLGAIAKGYATEQVGKYLKENKIDTGGNVLVGTKKDGKYKVGIQSPLENENIFKIINVNDYAVVTSGGYERFYEYNNVKYHHIIDPDTLYPANNMLSATVIAKSSTLADILSTTIFLMDPDKAINLIDSLEDIECIIYTNDYKILTSKGFSKYE